MITVDFRTIYFNFLLTNLVCFIVVGFLWLQSKDRFKGIGYLALDFLFQFVGVLLISLRELIPDFISINIGNALPILGALLGLVGLQHFINKKSSHIINIVLFGIYFFIHWFLTFIHPNIDLRNLNSSVFLLIFCSQSAWLLLKATTKPDKKVTFQTGVVFVLISVLCIVRILKFFIFKDNQTNYFNTGSFERIVIISYQLLLIFLTFSITLMINKRLQNSILSQEEKYMKAFQTTPYAIILTQYPEGKILEANQQFTKMSKFCLNEIIGKTTLEINFWNELKDRQTLLDSIEKRGKLKHLETLFRKKDGSLFSGIISSELISIEESNYLFSVIIDITYQKESEEKILKANRLYAVISQINQAIVHLKNREELLNEVCQIAIDYGKFQMAWVGLIENDTQFVIPCSIAGNNNGYLSVTEKITIKDEPQGRGPTGQAIRAGKYYVCNDIENNPLMNLWKDDAIKRGFKSSISLPLKQSGQIIGAFNLYAGQVNFFDEQEISLLEEVTNDISFALDSIEIQKLHHNTINALIESELKFKNLVNQMQYGLAVHETILDHDGNPIDYRFIDINPSFERITGIKKEDAIGKTVLDIMPNTESVWIENYGKVALTGEPITFENYSSELNKYFSVVAYQPQIMQFAVIVEDITSRKLVEQSLRESEERHRLMFETSQESIVIIQNSRLVYFNPKLMELTGYSIDEISSMEFLDFIHPDDKEMVRNHYMNRLSGINIDKKYQFRVFRKEGTIRWVNLSGSILQWNNSPAGFYFLSDISDLKLAEHLANERMKELNAFYKLGELIEEKNLSFNDFFQQFIKEIPLSWQYPEITFARINVQGIEFLTENYDKNSSWLIKSPITIKDLIIGEIEVGYLEEKPLLDEGPFMKEERLLINGLAERLGHIIERKQAEENLKVSEEKYRLLTENASDVIWVLDLESNRFTYISPAIVQLLGFTVEEAMSKTMEQSMTPDSFLKVIDAINEKLPEYIISPDSNSYYMTEIQQYNKDGLVIWVEVSAKIRINTEGKVEIVGVSRDIRERKKMEEEIKENERKFRLLFENSPLGIYIANSDGFIIDGNQSLLNILGSPSIEMTKQINVLKFPPLVENGYADLFINCVKNNQIYTAEMPYVSRWGKHAYLSSYLVPMANDSGFVENVYTLMEDITTRKQSEEALKNSELKLLEANATKDKFFSIIAHDLRSPFSTLVSFTEVLADEEAKLTIEDYIQYSRAINKTAISTFNLLENLLEWSRIQRGNITYNPTEINIRKYFENFDESIIETARKKSITVNVFSENELILYADLEMLNSTLRNLVSNAIKFSFPGNSIIIRTTLLPSDEILFSVQDFGIGMDKERINNLFRIDSNVGRPGTNGEPSTGLGLILCKEFIEKHNGRIWVDSEVDKGSTFYFTIKQFNKNEKDKD